MTDRLAWESAELRGLARERGARRVVRNGVPCWEFPMYVCPHCGPNVPPQPDCPEPLALHLVEGGA